MQKFLILILISLFLFGSLSTTSVVNEFNCICDDNSNQTSCEENGFVHSDPESANGAGCSCGSGNSGGTLTDCRGNSILV